jgi:hypothetical protein
MKFATAKEHRDFFVKNGWIEFEDFITPDVLAEADETIQETLGERLKEPHRSVLLADPERLFKQGRDLWRSSPVLKKLALQARFAEIASELIEKRPLRLAYDQFLPSMVKGSEGGEAAYASFLGKKQTLQESSCMTEVLCGVVLALNGTQQEKEEQSALGMPVFPSKAGHAIYFKSDAPIDWSLLIRERGRHFYLIAYCSAYSRYVLNGGDPQTHALKRLGYIFNDKLKEHLHPIVFR